MIASFNLELSGGGNPSWDVAKCLSSYFRKKSYLCHLREISVQTFCNPYMESSLPALFHDTAGREICKEMTFAVADVFTLRGTLGKSFHRPRKVSVPNPL